MLSLGMNLFITTQGFTKFSMLATVIGALSNIALDPLFIFTLNMGVRGAAYATVISQALSAGFVILFLTGRRTKLRLRPKYFVPKIKMMLPIYALGLGPFVMQSTEALLQIAFNSSLQKYGGDIAVGAMTIAGTVMQMMWLPAQGVGQGAQPIISYNYGAGNPKRVKLAVKYMFIIACAYMFALWCVIEICPQAFIKIFSNNIELYDTATWALRIYIASVGIMGLQASSQQFFMSIGKAKASLFVALFRKVIVLIPLIFILPNFFQDKVFAVFLAEPVADFVSVCACTTIFAVVFTKEIRKLQNRTDVNLDGGSNGN
jgi:putative MATE family efflux protein